MSMLQSNLVRLRQVFHIWWNRDRILELIRGNLEDAWPAVEKVWSQAAGVYQTRLGASARLPFELELVRELSKSGERAEALFDRGLLNQNPQVSAYCLIGMVQLKSARLKSLPEALLQRGETILVHSGCFTVSRTLGEFAKQTATGSR